MISSARLLLILPFLALTSRAGMRTDQFADGRPLFNPAKFFEGRTRSTGVMENRGGMPAERVTTETRGRRSGDTLSIEQDLVLGDNYRQHRSWRLRQFDPHHFEATANDIVGTARGEAYGNVFHWAFTLALSPGNPLANVRMSQWMYLQPDGKTMLNHSTISKAGIVLRQVTEQFRKHESSARKNSAD